ncbi:MAG: GNAT family N-acetyltransferase [Bryobacterales bacterium]|nr:GNAT family N-acetyltransferase [Bryobacterales bacterium]
MIRRACLADAETLASFNERMAWETEHLTLDAERIRLGVRAALEDESKGFYLVAERGGQVVGQLMVTYEWSDWRNGAFWWIQSVYVYPDYRGQGIYSGLYRHLERLARQTPEVCGLRLYVEQDNNRACEVYQRLGMTITAYRLLEVDFVIQRPDPAAH